MQSPCVGTTRRGVHDLGHVLKEILGDSTDQKPRAGCPEPRAASLDQIPAKRKKGFFGGCRAGHHDPDAGGGVVVRRRPQRGHPTLCARVARAS